MLSGDMYCVVQKERFKVPHLPRQDNTSSVQEQEGVAEHPISLVHANITSLYALTKFVAGQTQQSR